MVHEFIRKWLSEISTDIANQTRIIFGGSINENNAENFIS